MDFEHNNHIPPQPEQIEPTQPQPSGMPPTTSQTPPATTSRKRTGWRIFWAILFALSVLANIVFLLMLIGLATLLLTSRETPLTEHIIRQGPASTKIAVVTIEGIIDAGQADMVEKQLKRARKDDTVKGIILRINSPGGTISASDRIHHLISEKTDKPVVAFMEGLAASGGYYTSVACDKIVAEPTAITGSIGVIAGWFVIKNLLEQKLGIEPVIVKSGEKKDWPSSFREASPEEIAYLKEKLINPAYKRFVKIVTEGRKDYLNAEDVNSLADGSIFSAQEAMDKKLIDSVGYLDEAIEQVKALAAIKKARVVEYRKPFSLSDFLNSRSNPLKIDSILPVRFS